MRIGRYCVKLQLCSVAILILIIYGVMGCSPTPQEHPSSTPHQTKSKRAELQKFQEEQQERSREITQKMVRKQQKDKEDLRTRAREMGEIQKKTQPSPYNK